MKAITSPITTLVIVLVISCNYYSSNNCNNNDDQHHYCYYIFCLILTMALFSCLFVYLHLILSLYSSNLIASLNLYISTTSSSPPHFFFFPSFLFFLISSPIRTFPPLSIPTLSFPLRNIPGGGVLLSANSSTVGYRRQGTVEKTLRGRTIFQFKGEEFIGRCNL